MVLLVLLVIPFVLVLLGQLSGSIVMPLLIIAVVPTAISMWRWGLLAKQV
jgi:hypothetical protein